MRDRVFYSICFGFGLGVLLRSFVFIDLYFTVFLGLLSLALFLIFFVLRSPSEVETNTTFNKWGIIASIFILAFSLGIFRFHLADRPAPAAFESAVGQKVSLSGEIVDEPELKQNDQQLTVLVKDGPSQTKIVISAGLDRTFHYGDEINFTGKLKKPDNFATDQGNEFDYVNYLRKDGIFYLMSYPAISPLSTGHGNFIKRDLFAIKEKFIAGTNFLIPSPESIFAGGLMFGEKANFNQTLKQNFVNTGMIHLVTLSGYKITMLSGWFMKLFSFLPQLAGLGLGILAILLFVLMTGGAATTIVFQKHIARELELDICCIG